MLKSRTETWAAVIVVAVGLLIAAIPGLWVYMRATATSLHPNPQDVTSVTSATPVGQWTGPAEQGRRLVRAALTAQNLPGLSVAVGAGGEIVWAEGFGWADLDRKATVSPHTRFRIGTASKALTSAAVGLLLEKDQLKLDEEIQTYVPDFPRKEWPVTLRQLMGHLAGVRTDSGDEGPLFSVQCERPVEALRHFKDAPLLFEPGTQYRYSSYGWILVSAAVEAAADEPFFAFMQKHIFEPLGMVDTEAESAIDPIRERATSYFPRFAADPRYGLHLMRPLDYSCYAGAGAFLSTPSDLVRFGMAMDRGQLLQPGTVRLLRTSQQTASGQDTGYGLGWDFETVALGDRQTRVVGHDGDSLGGMVASLLTFPEHGIVVAVTSNISYADTAAVALSIAQAFAPEGKRPARN
jgi:CubicO group peptidase (beta-lactamase class C family)